MSGVCVGRGLSHILKSHRNRLLLGNQRSPWVPVRVQNVDRCKQKRQKMLVRVLMMDLYEHSEEIQRPWHCANTESKEIRSEATEPAGERRLLPPAPSPRERVWGWGNGEQTESPRPCTKPPGHQSRAGFRTWSLTIIEPILTILEKCICLVFK